MKRALALTAAIALIVSVALTSPVPSQDLTPAGKYAAYCGEYQFDLASYGIGTVTARVYAENDVLYIWASTSDDPDVLSPVEGQPAKFFIDDPDEGHWDIEFLKDDAGKYSKCHIVNTGAGIDAVGQRIGG